MHKINITNAEFAEKVLFLNGRPFSLEDYPHMTAIYNNAKSNQVLKFSRQTAKSTTLANIGVTEAVTIPHYKILYVSPSSDQTKLFSSDRVKPVIEQSPIIKNYYTNPKLVQNVFTKQFTNHSIFYLRYALLDPDRLRGISTDRCIFDEVQDQRQEVMDVIMESMTRSEYKRIMYAGTPKRSRGTLSTLWNNSTQNEYIVKCSSCNHWNILGEENIGKTGVVCAKCGKLLNLKAGEWVSSYSLTQKIDQDGWRVCALHFANAPWVNWQRDIIRKQEKSSKAIFYNEVLALEWDEGQAPITEEQVRRACTLDRPMIAAPDKEKYPQEYSYQTMMGVDYGPEHSDRSNTVTVIVQRRPGKYVVLWAKKFIGKEADYSYIHRELPKIFNTWTPIKMATDKGMGEATNSEMRARLGHDKIISYQHLDNISSLYKYDQKSSCINLNRNMAMYAIFELIKKGLIEFPDWNYFKDYAEDMLNIQIEYNETKDKQKYINIGPDDFFHALLFAVLTFEFMNIDASLLKEARILDNYRI